MRNDFVTTLVRNQGSRNWLTSWRQLINLHVGRLRERGYNQALEIARPVARKLRIPLLTQDCQRVQATVQQASMSAELRQRNIKNAFQIDAKLPYRHIAIIDDVVTTGSTAAELTRVLRQAGVARVDVWCCAKTVLRGKSNLAVFPTCLYPTLDQRLHAGGKLPPE